MLPEGRRCIKGTKSHTVNDVKVLVDAIAIAQISNATSNLYLNCDDRLKSWMIDKRREYIKVLYHLNKDIEYTTQK